MAKKHKANSISPQTHDEAIKAARATQRPGQTKEQTKLIAQGIEKGINHYKKQQKAKVRELNKKIHKASRQLTASEENNDEVTQDNTISKRTFLPWVLLLMSWVGFVAYFVMK